MQPSDIPEQAIRRLLDEQVTAWNAGDAKAWCKDFAPDADFVNILGMHFRGRDSNEVRHAELFAGVFNGSHLALQEVNVRVLGETTAIANAVLVLTNFRKLPPGIRPSRGNDVLRTRMHYTLAGEADRWRIFFSQNTAIMPLPSA